MVEIAAMALALHIVERNNDTKAGFAAAELR
jgi:hypothetical protein